MTTARGNTVLLLALAALTTSGCDPQARGFSLPPGDANKGLTTFQELQCNQCHSIPKLIKKRYDSLYPDVEIALGGPVHRVKTYGELVTAIIHPGKAVSRPVPEAAMTDEDTSIMPIYNGAMTVEQLVDLTTFLQQTYELQVPPYTPYMH
ncbi:MAG: cytochrome C [Pseudomonadota bacterium]